MHGDRNRPFNYAVLASIALHALLLFAFTALEEPAPREATITPIVAHLVEPAPLPASPPPALPEVKKPAPVKKPASAKPRAAAKPLPLPVPESLPEPAPAAPPAVEPEQAAPAPPSQIARGEPAGPPIVARTAPTLSPAPPSEDAIDAHSVAQYRLQVLGAARKYKRYPRVAMDNNWEGEVLVRMVIAANGLVASVSVKTSSGYEVLDDQALEMFRKAMPMVQIPPALRGREFSIEVRAIYDLKDQASG